MANGATRFRPKASAVAQAMKPPWLLSSDAHAQEASWKVAQQARPRETRGEIKPRLGHLFSNAAQ
eukprot:4404507-Alexandrium_andersonii.AAC.1